MQITQRNSTTREEVKNVRSINGLLDELGELTPNEANNLIKSSDCEIRKRAINYADRQSKLARLSVEDFSEVIDPILNSLGELTIEETDKLLKAHTLKVIKYAMLNVCSEGLEELRDVIIEKLKYIKE